MQIRKGTPLPFKKRLRMQIGDIISRKKMLRPEVDNGFRVLVYHSVTDKLIKNDWEENTIPKDLFERQMKYLADNRYNIISCKQVIEYLRRGQKLPSRGVAITFDDGYKNNYINALPILQKYNFCATIFITPGFLQDYSGDTRYLSCSEVINIEKSGIIDFGCHGLTHKALSRLDRKQLDEEITAGRRILEYLTHNKIELFAYPFGHSKSFNTHVIEKVKGAGFIGAFTAIFGLNRLDTDPFLIRRNSVSWLDELGIFERHLMGAYDWYALFEYFRPKRYHY